MALTGDEINENTIADNDQTAPLYPETSLFYGMALDAVDDKEAALNRYQRDVGLRELSNVGMNTLAYMMRDLNKYYEPVSAKSVGRVSIEEPDVASPAMKTAEASYATGVELLTKAGRPEDIGLLNAQLFKQTEDIYGKDAALRAETRGKEAQLNAQLGAQDARTALSAEGMNVEQRLRGQEFATQQETAYLTNINKALANLNLTQYEVGTALAELGDERAMYTALLDEAKKREAMFEQRQGKTTVEEPEEKKDDKGTETTADTTTVDKTYGIDRTDLTRERGYYASSPEALMPPVYTSKSAFGQGQTFGGLYAPVIPGNRPQEFTEQDYQDTVNRIMAGIETEEAIEGDVRRNAAIGQMVDDFNTAQEEEFTIEDEQTIEDIPFDTKEIAESVTAGLEEARAAEAEVEEEESEEISFPDPIDRGEAEEITEADVEEEVTPETPTDAEDGQSAVFTGLDASADSYFADLFGSTTSANMDVLKQYIKPEALREDRNWTTEPLKKSELIPYNMVDGNVDQTKLGRFFQESLRGQYSDNMLAQSIIDLEGLRVSPYVDEAGYSVGIGSWMAGTEETPENYRRFDEEAVFGYTEIGDIFQADYDKHQAHLSDQMNILFPDPDSYGLENYAEAEAILGRVNYLMGPNWHKVLAGGSQYWKTLIFNDIAKGRYDSARARIDKSGIKNDPRADQLKSVIDTLETFNTPEKL